jgi:hypothetical protein
MLPQVGFANSKIAIITVMRESRKVNSEWLVTDVLNGGVRNRRTRIAERIKILFRDPHKLFFNNIFRVKLNVS